MNVTEVIQFLYYHDYKFIVKLTVLTTQISSFRSTKYIPSSNQINGKFASTAK